MAAESRIHGFQGAQRSAMWIASQLVALDHGTIDAPPPFPSHLIAGGIAHEALAAGLADGIEFLS